MAAISAAAAEDTLIFEGNKNLGVSGLFNAKGVQSVDLGKWDDIGTAANDVIRAVTALDRAGFHGPYLLALTPDLYNLLFRLYLQGYQIIDAAHRIRGREQDHKIPGDQEGRSASRDRRAVRVNCRRAGHYHRLRLVRRTPTTGSK